MTIAGRSFLVTGANGFVWAAVTRQLLAAGGRVRALTRAGSDRRNLQGLDVEVATGDLLEPGSLVPAFEGVDGLFHVAADYRLWAPDPKSMFQANVEGTRAILRAAGAAGVRRAVYTSSVAVLGARTDGFIADEESPVSYADMIGPYKQSKFLAEEAARAVMAEIGIDCVIVNPSTPIGPGDVKPTPTGRLIVEAASGRMPAYVDTGLNVVHVDDVAAGHLQAFEKGRKGERYILGGENMTLCSILNEIAALAHVRPPRVQIPRAAIYPVAIVAEAWCRAARRGEPFVTVDGLKMSRKKMYFSSAKATRDIGYRFRPAAEALADAVRWFGEQGYLQ